MNFNIGSYTFEHLELHPNIFQINVKHIARRDCVICVVIYFINYMYIGSKTLSLEHCYLNVSVIYVSSDPEFTS